MYRVLVRRAFVVLAVFAAMPAAFEACMAGFRALDRYLAVREVAAFVAEHREFVAEQRRSRWVYKLELAPDPARPWVLKGEYDVLNLEVFNGIDPMLLSTWSFRFPAEIEGKVRSGEKPSDVPGAGLGAAFHHIEEKLAAIAISALAGLAAGAAIGWVGWRWARTPTGPR